MRRKFSVNLLIVILVTILYAATFPSFSSFLSRSTCAFSIIGVVGWALILGRWAGLIAGIASLPLNLLLLKISGIEINFTVMGTYFWMYHAGAIILGFLTGYIRDLFIRMEKQLEELKSTRKDYALLVDDLNISDSRWMTQFQELPLPAFIFKFEDDNFILDSFNNSAHEVTQGRVEKLVGKLPDELYPAMETITEDLAECWNSGEVIRREIKYTSPTSGITVYLINTYSHVPPDYVTLYTIDITELKNVENVLRMNEERERNIIEVSRDAIILADMNGKIKQANTNACELFDYNSEDIEGVDLAKLFPDLCKEDLNTGVIDPFITGNIPVETVGITNEKYEFPAELNSVLINDTDGTSGCLFVRDISERKKVEEERSRTQKLHTANQLAFTIAHEFNNPLSILKGAADILSMENIDEENKKEFLKKIPEQVTRMHQLVEKFMKLQNVKDVDYASGLKIIDIHDEADDKDESELPEVNKNIDDKPEA